VTSTNYVYLNPIFTLISAMIFLGEKITPIAAIGSAAILLGVIWAGKGNPS
jgi:drug/metabolite transporter (DMT)-like permease